MAIRFCCRARSSAIHSGLLSAVSGHRRTVTSVPGARTVCAIGVEAVPDLQFFRAWIELGTISAPDPRDRTYTVQYDPVVLADPPPAEALAAVLAHELGHVDHYLGMSTEEAVQFGVWYGTQDPTTSDDLAAYERETDEKVLARGCAAGLAAMRVWIYEHVEGDVLVEKERNYYTPDEIAAWLSQHGTCTR